MFTIFRRKKTEAPQTADFMVVGLGNPGARYDGTRHNAGFLAVDLLAERLGGGRLTKTKCKATYALCALGGSSVLLAKPQTFMNLSGEAVRGLADAYQVPPERIIVLFDDAALAPGRLRVRRGGTDGGHNGIKSIIYQLGSDQFPRVKIGIGSPDRERGEDMADFVLSPLDAGAYAGVKLAPDAACAIIGQGVDQAMQLFNGKPPGSPA